MRMNRPTLVAITFQLLGLSMFASPATAQIRMNLRNAMQIDGLEAGPNPDERFWPIECNAFAPGDVDGDGDLDLLVAANLGPSRVWLNDGGGGFDRFVSLSALPLGGARCALFDADGDGDLDALVAGGRTTYAGPTPSGLFLNDGAGAFTLSPTIPNDPANFSIEASSLSVADLDGDGDKDVFLSLLSSFQGPYSRLWRNVGNATFVDDTAAVQPPLTGYGQRATLFDVEPDGDLDIVRTTSPHNLVCDVRLNDGTGYFSLGTAITYDVPLVNAALADLDGDGLQDQVGVVNDDVFPSVIDVPYVRRNLGNGQFQDVSSTWFEPHALVDQTYGYSFHACAVFDADGDGDLDFVTGGSEGRNTTSTTVGVPPRLFVNLVGQTFLDAGKLALPMQQATAAAIEAGDIDGDGDVDLVGWLWNSYGITWRQDAAGTFAVATGPRLGAFTSLSAMKLADVDGDGDLDLFGIAGWGPLFPGTVGQHRLALNDGSGNFTDVTAARMPATAQSGGASCCTGDVDGDGDVDLVVGSYDPGFSGSGVPLMLLLNDGTGFFTDASAQLPTTAFQSGHVALRDFDGDGDVDLVVGADPYHPTTRPLLYFDNNGAGVFTDATVARLPVTVGATGLSVLDLDNDGDLDLAQSNVDLVNDGAGTFTAVSVAASRLVVADFDQDGSPDGIAEIGSSSSSYGLRVVGGRDVFEDTMSEGHFVLPVDLDRDDDLDLVAASYPGWGSFDSKRLRVELIYNLRRDLRVMTHPRLGYPYRMQLRATNGTQPTLGLVLIAAATLSPPVAIPDWGHLVLDPLAIIPWAVVVIPDADTAAEAVLLLANDAALHGLPLSCQALLIPIGAEQHTHLTNAMTHTIER